MMGVGVVVVVAAALSGLAEGLYFHIGKTERKCFNEEIPDETMVTGNYTLQLYDPHIDDFLPSSPGLGMHVEVRDPDDKVLLSRVYSSEGRFTFTSHTPGKHVICLSSNSTKWLSGSELSVHVDIQVGEHAVDYASMAKEETLQTKLELRVSHLLEQVEQITQELNYLRDREERFRQTYKSTYQQVLWWSVGQVAILLGLGFWQIRHLRSYSRIASEIRHLMRPETRYPVGADIGSQVFLDWLLENYSNDCGSPVEPVPPPKGSVPVSEN